MKKVVRLTESDLINIVKQVINESNINDSVETKIETASDGQDITNHVEELFVGKTPEEIKNYFLDLNNRKPKLLKRLLRFFYINKKDNRPYKKQSETFGKKMLGVLTNAIIWTLIKQTIGVKIKELLNLPSLTDDKKGI
jgi:hypothetical protein